MYFVLGQHDFTHPFLIAQQYYTETTLNVFESENSVACQASEERIRGWFSWRNVEKYITLTSIISIKSCSPCSNNYLASFEPATFQLWKMSKIHIAHRALNAPCAAWALWNNRGCLHEHSSQHWGENLPSLCSEAIICHSYQVVTLFVEVLIKLLGKWKPGGATSPRWNSSINS